MWATLTTVDFQPSYTFSHFKKVRSKYNNNLWTILFAISIHSICCKIYESLLISRLVFRACLFVCLLLLWLLDLFDLALRLCFYRFLVLLYKYININTSFIFTKHIGKPVSNTTKSLCIPWSWTNNLSRWNKRHRKKRWVALYHSWSSFKENLLEWNVKKSLSPYFWRLFVSQW